jgi:RNA polymerase sigma-70 factor (ECF subfamily)
VSVPTINSALQRARVTLSHHHRGHAVNAETARSERLASLLTRYVQAWEAEDSTNLIALLREDATLTMPPIPAWYRGRVAIKEFLERHIFVGPRGDRLRLTPTRANGCPAFAVYQRDSTGIFQPVALHVLSMAFDQITQIDDFLVSSRLFAHFGPLLMIDR